MERNPIRDREPQPGFVFDLAIIGGGINGAGIARDAAGRGWSVYLCEQGDLAGATSSASTKLIHGGLRYLEYYAFRLVRESLREREVLWSIAPHLIRPLRFVLPHHAGLRPAWLLRTGLFLYDHIGGRRLLPATRTLRLQNDPAGSLLKPEFTLAFEYSDCWVDDARLVVLNARDAAERGAEIAPRTRAIAAERSGGMWLLTVEDAMTGRHREVRARALVNAAGPWVATVLTDVLHANRPAAVRLVQGSHIVVRKLFDHDRAYLFQNADGRIFFAIPFQHDFTLIGTTDLDYSGDPAKVHISAAEQQYLCAGASAYFRAPVTPGAIVWGYSGVRPLYDDGASAAQEATRDYVLSLDAPKDAPPLLSAFGGKITTYRRLAEATLAQLAPYLPPASTPTGWTARAPLPGGDFPVDGFDALVLRLRETWPFLTPAFARRLGRAYGTRALTLLKGMRSEKDLGQRFGADLTEAELDYLARHEWAMTAEDVLWRRTKLGLRLAPSEVEAVERAMAAIGKPAATVQ
jgi:glycerol-3-phosphate dehydrogenase